MRAIVFHEEPADLFDVLGWWRLFHAAGLAIVGTRRGRIDLDDVGGIVAAVSSLSLAPLEDSVMVKAASTPAVGYIRMSSDKQEASPARQRSEIVKLAEHGGYRIIAWYEDHGLTGTQSLNRPEFQRLLKDAAEGTFKAILLFEQSRFSREDPFDAMLHWRLLRAAGVKLVACHGGELAFDNMGGLITAIVSQQGAHDESVKISARVVSGLRKKLDDGHRPFGRSVFALDRELYDESGELVRVVSFRDRFEKPRGWRHAFVPSAEAEAVDAIRWAFEATACDGLSASEIARDFNRRGLKTATGGRFAAEAVRYILTNPAYVGSTRVFNKYNPGKFHRVADDGPLLFDETHVGFVDRATFDVVQALFDRRAGSVRPRRHAYILRGLLVCGHCNRRMRGHGTCGPKANRSSRRYSCVHDEYQRSDCPKPRVDARGLERFVLSVIQDRVFCDENRERLRTGALEAANEKNSESPEARQLRELRHKIERGTQNLALAESDDDFAAVSKLLAAWREDEQLLLKRLMRGTSRRPAPAELVEAIEGMAAAREHLDEAAPGHLVAMFAQLIARITIRRRNIYSRAFKLEGEMVFHSEVCSEPVVPFTDADVTPSTRWREVASFISDAGQSVTRRDIEEALGIGTDAVNNALRLACRRGLVTKGGPTNRRFRYSAAALR
ncbi:MAG: recombinase family protein [Planctomycetaceae bacterium]|nr:recombinase family protein [Planctomycetaceae bacterium]